MKTPADGMRPDKNAGIFAIIFLAIGLFMIPVMCIAAESPEDAVQLYDEEMLLRDLNDKAKTTGENQQPLVQSVDKDNQVAIEVPLSIKYNTSLIEEGARLYRSGKYSEAVSVFETAREIYWLEGFIEGEIAAVGNLYLTYLALGDEEKASEYLEEYRKKRRRK